MSYEKVAEAKNSLVIGAKQVQKAMRDGEVQEVVVAENAERRVTDHILLTADQMNVPVVFVDSMKQLGKQAVLK